jgi:transposase InsO family protein
MSLLFFLLIKLLIWQLLLQVCEKRGMKYLFYHFKHQNAPYFALHDSERSSGPEGWLYLAVVLDLFSRMVVGWAMAAIGDATLVAHA